MKLSAALYFLVFSSCAIAAPISTTLDKVPGRADLSNSGLQQQPRIKLPIKTPIGPQSKASGKKTAKKGSKAQGIRPSNGQLQLSSGGIAKPSPKKASLKPKKPKSSSYLASLAHQLTNKSPFSESSIVREETRASTGDWEKEATIVEWETKASREATIWLPCLTTDKTIHYHRVRVNTDMLVVSLVLSFIAVVVVIELWKPVAARVRRFRSGLGPISLDSNGATSNEISAQKPSVSCGTIIGTTGESKQEVVVVETATTTR